MNVVNIYTIFEQKILRNFPLKFYNLISGFVMKILYLGKVKVMVHKIDRIR